MGLVAGAHVLLAASLLSSQGREMEEGLALLINPGGVVSVKNFVISVGDPQVTRDGKTFAYNGRTYPYGGPSYWKHIDDETRRLDVLRHIKVESGKALAQIGHEWRSGGLGFRGRESGRKAARPSDGRSSGGPNGLLRGCLGCDVGPRGM